VFGIETFLSLDGVGAGFYKDILIIGKDGNELLAPSPTIGSKPEQRFEQIA
jgi:hypothetical protein